MAVVGLGPKGLFALERMLHHARDAELDVDVFEPHPAPGAGPVYDPAQPGYLRMNLADDLVDLWPAGSRAVPEARQRSFSEWSDAAGGADDYAPRALVGEYLADGLALLRAHAPTGVRVRLHRDAVEAVHRGDGTWVVRRGPEFSAYDEVLLATGHARTWSGALPVPVGAAVVPAVFPVERRLARDAVPAGCTVAVRGFALTAIDAMLALTEGRGGRFVPGGGGLRYVPGGDEPSTILPFARQGRPMAAKPLAAVAADVPGLDDLMAGGRDRVLALERPAELTSVLADVADAALRAAGGDSRPPGPSLHPAAELERSIRVAAGNVAPDRTWALGHTWRALYPAIVERLGGPGLSADEREGFRRLAAEMERVAFGPPLRSARRLLALVTAGVVDLEAVAGGRLEERPEGTVLRGPAGERRVDVVIDAVLPPPGLPGDSHGLWAQLTADGHVHVAPGHRGIDVDTTGGCLDDRGRPVTGLSAIGRVTEDVVIGNDTLSRSLHPQADRWAARIAARARDLHATPA